MNADTQEELDLSALDFDPQCEWGNCDDPATHVAKCRECGRYSFLLCGSHAIRTGYTDTLIRHVPCGRQAPLADLMDVVPL